jgi:LacI family transcriptional regulator
MGGRITLKDIAEDMDISRTTVHRALSGKEGISDQLRAQICNRAAEMGYTANYVASSLKRKTVCLAAVLPRRDGLGRYYHKYFWDAIEKFLPEAESLNVSVKFYSFDEEKNDQVAVLQRLLDGAEPVDGLLTMPAQCDDAMQRVLERFADKGIPVVLIDNDLPDSRRLCCVAPHNQMTGRLGAEILTGITHTPGKILVADGSAESASHRHNLKGFREYIEENQLPFELLEIQGYENTDKCYAEACRLLRSDPEIVAFYSVTARNTLPLGHAVQDCGLAGKLRGVGSDLYPESAELLRENVVQAILYKNAYDKGHLGFRVLFDYVVKGIPPENEKLSVPISIIMKNNLQFFARYL